MFENSQAWLASTSSPMTCKLNIYNIVSVYTHVYIHSIRTQIYLLFFTIYGLWVMHVLIFGFKLYMETSNIRSIYKSFVFSFLRNVMLFLIAQWYNEYGHKLRNKMQIISTNSTYPCIKLRTKLILSLFNPTCRTVK